MSKPNLGLTVLFFFQIYTQDQLFQMQAQCLCFFKTSMASRNTCWVFCSFTEGISCKIVKVGKLLQLPLQQGKRVQSI